MSERPGEWVAARRGFEHVMTPSQSQRKPPTHTVLTAPVPGESRTWHRHALSHRWRLQPPAGWHARGARTRGGVCRERLEPAVFDNHMPRGPTQDRTTDLELKTTVSESRFDPRGWPRSQRGWRGVLPHSFAPAALRARRGLCGPRLGLGSTDRTGGQVRSETQLANRRGLSSVERGYLFFCFFAAPVMLPIPDEPFLRLPLRCTLRQTCSRRRCCSRWLCR